jgi:hypothetical protein
MRSVLSAGACGLAGTAFLGARALFLALQIRFTTAALFDFIVLLSHS